MSHVSNFTHSDKEIITALLLFDNPGLVLSPNLVDYLNPAPLSGERNSILTVAPRPGSEYTGTVDVTFNRLDIQAFVDLFAPEGITLQLDDPQMFSALVPDINLALGVNLSVGEYADFELPKFSGEPNEVITIEVPILPGSLIYTGTLVFALKTNPISLISVISVTQLTGLSYPST